VIRIKTAGNKMFLQWCRDELFLSFIFVQRLVSWDRTRLRKGTTAETQTLPTGNCCYRFYNEAYFEDAFNQRTKELLGIVKPKKKRKAASR
jgi:hypothetical protein